MERNKVERPNVNHTSMVLEERKQKKHHKILGKILSNIILEIPELISKFMIKNMQTSKNAIFVKHINLKISEKVATTRNW